MSTEKATNEPPITTEELPVTTEVEVTEVEVTEVEVTEVEVTEIFVAEEEVSGPGNTEMQEGKVQDFFVHAGKAIADEFTMIGHKIVAGVKILLPFIESKVTAIINEFLRDLASGKNLKEAGNEALDDAKQGAKDSGKLAANEASKIITERINASDLDGELKANINMIVEQQRDKLHDKLSAEHVEVLANKIASIKVPTESTTIVTTAHVVSVQLPTQELAGGQVFSVELPPLSLDWDESEETDTGDSVAPLTDALNQSTLGHENPTGVTPEHSDLV